MFIKKRPTDLPKAPDLSQVKDFSLFGLRPPKGDSARPVESGGQAARRRTAAMDDVIDIEVVEWKEVPAEPPAPREEVVQPAALDTPPAARETPPIAGLKILRKTAAAEPVASPVEPEPVPVPPEPVRVAQPAAESAAEPVPRVAGAPETQSAADTLDTPPVSNGSAFAKFAKKKNTSPKPPVEGKKPFSFFGRNTSKNEPAVAAAEPTPGMAKSAAPSPLAGLAARLTRKPGKDPLVAKPPTAKPVGRAAPKGSIDILVELDGSKKVFWRVSAQDVVELDPDTVPRAASFAKSEYRYRAEAPLAYAGAQDLALAEVGEEVRIVNASKKLQAVYASTATRIAELLPVETGPGLLLLETLLRDDRVEGEDVICGLVLTAADASLRLAVLYHFTAQNEVAAVQVTVNPDNLNFVLAQFASSRRLDPNETKAVLFRNEDLLRVAGAFVPYPSEPVWHGIVLRKVLWAAATATAVAATGLALYAAQGYYLVHSAQSETDTQQEAKRTAQKSVDTLLAASVRSFAVAQSIDMAKVTERAGALWSPGSTVSVEATASSQKYTVAFPLTHGGMVGNRPSVLAQVTLDKVEPLLNQKPPAGCTKAVPEISGGMNAIQVTITCQNLAGALTAYRLD